MNHIIGLDVGIGSVGWAVINLDKHRIEDCGVRIFESGENAKGSKSKCQERRESRGIRRLNRRTSHRKSRLKAHFELIGLTTENKINEYFMSGNTNIIALRVKAISEKVTPEELVACLIHICNHRGYSDFYSLGSVNEELLTQDEKKDSEGIKKVKKIMANGNYRTPAEMIWKNEKFNSDSGEFRKYRNSETDKDILIPRKLLEDEVSLILEKQSEFYPCLNKESIDKINSIIFSQRAFEEGPGDKDDDFRKYKGFLDSIGKCSFYSEEKRGSRFTAIADIYALVNTLSQYNYYDKENNNCFNGDLARELISFALENGSMTRSDVNKIAKKYKITINVDNEITKCFRYIKSVKPAFESAGYDWKKLIENYIEDYIDTENNYAETENNILDKVGITLSKYITPRIRLNELLKLNIDEELVKKLLPLKFSGTTNVSYKYMKGSIKAFLEGDIYGKYQAKFLKENNNTINENDKPKKLPPFKNEDDCEFYDNPVVFRAINETRKVVNAIVDKYGYPCAVNIETADEVNKSYADRENERKNNDANKERNDRIKKEIAEILKVQDDSVRPVQIEKYKLWEAQGGKCLYSGEKIDKEVMLIDDSNLYEIDHIVPFSLILDNTLNNKALVCREENQIKGQRTPLMYMTDEQANSFKARVNEMYKTGNAKKGNNLSKRKYQYLMLTNLDDSELLDEWKSRNLNDTRYISKYLVNYLKNNLRFNPQCEFDGGFKITEGRRVFAVKSKFTSYFRKQWLNPETWGRKDKSELKKITYLDHAADAIVIANCRPEYVIIAGEKMKLYNIYKNAGKRITKEYNDSLNNCLNNLERYYGIDRYFAKKLLDYHSSKLEPIVTNIISETDNRLRDFNTHREIFKNAKKDTDEKIIKEFESQNLSNYHDDPEFAKSLKMPVISYKPEKGYDGEVTDSNPISIKEIDGELKQVERKNIKALKAKELSSVRSEDKDLIDSLTEIFAGKEDSYTVDNYLKEKKLPYFLIKREDA